MFTFIYYILHGALARKADRRPSRLFTARRAPVRGAPKMSASAVKICRKSEGFQAPRGKIWKNMMNFDRLLRKMYENVSVIYIDVAT